MPALLFYAVDQTLGKVPKAKLKSKAIIWFQMGPFGLYVDQDWIVSVGNV